MLRERLRAIIEGLKILCPHLQKYDGILRENLKKFEEAVGKGVDKFLGEMETLTNPEAIRDLKELKETINSVIDLKQWKEPMRKELENLETAIYRLQTLAAVREPPPPNSNNGNSSRFGSTRGLEGVRGEG